MATKKRKIALWIYIIFVVGVLVVWVGLLKPFILKSTCQLNLEYPFPLAMRFYADENPEKRYPPMSDISGRLFVTYENTMGYGIGEESGSLFCLDMPKAYNQQSLLDQFSQPTYLYTGYVLENEDQLLAFLELYPGFLESKIGFNENLPAPKGRGTFGGDQFIRLSETLMSEQPELDFPLIIELPTYTKEGMKFRHGDQGGNIKFLSSGTRWVPYADDQFPMTPTILEKIGEIKRAYQQ